MQNQNRPNASQPAARNVSIRYDKASITHTSQFLLSPSDEELIVDLSSGLIREPRGNETLPIHTRLSMSWSTAERLAGLLNQVVQRRPAKPHASSAPQAMRQDKPTASGTPVPAPKAPVASIPSLTPNQGVRE